MNQDRHEGSHADLSEQPIHSHKLGDELHVAHPVKRHSFTNTKISKAMPAFAFVLLFGVMGAYYLVSSKADPTIPVAKQVSALERARKATLDLGSVDRALQKSEKAELNDQYTELAKERKDAIKELLKEGHVDEVWSMMDTEGHKKANPNAQKNLEKRASFSKQTLRLDHGHSLEELTGNAPKENSNHDHHEYDYYYLDNGTSRKRIHLTKEPDDKLLNKKVSAKDIVELGGEAIADTSQLQLDTAQEALTTPATTVKKLAVVLVGVPGTKVPALDNKGAPITKEQIKSLVFGTTGTTVNTFLKEASLNNAELGGITDPAGDVFDWVPVKTAYTAGAACDYTAWASEADTALTSKGVNLTGYTNVMYVLSGGNCGWGGLAYVGTPGSATKMRSWIAQNALPGVTSTYWSVKTMAHELGHNFGAMHAGSYRCTENGVPVTYSAVTTNCSNNEYGDPYDVMGAKLRDFSNYFKLRNGYIPATNLQTIAASGTYQLKSSATATTGIQIIRVPAVVDSKGVVTSWYHLEYRQPTGTYDNFAATDSVVNGITIRLGEDYKGAYRTRLLDMTPSTTSDATEDGALAWGKTFTDTARGTQITAVSASGGIATVKITYTAPTCTQNTPTFSISPTSQWGDPGKTLSYSLSVTNNDTANCASQSFNIAAALPAGFTQALSSQSVSLAPGASTTVTATITSSTNTAAGYYPISEQLTRSGSSTVLGTASANYNVNQVVNEPPIVTITSPVDGGIVSGRKATITTSASSTSTTATVTSIKLYVDGGLKASGTSSINYAWDLKKVKSGQHTITVIATNSKGVSSSKTITISKS